MRDFVIHHTGRFFLLWLGGVVAGTGLGSIALANGVPLAVIVYAELILQMALAAAVAFGVPDRLGGAVAMVLVTILPLGALVTWIETVLRAEPSVAIGVAIAGAVIAGAAVWRPSLVQVQARA